MQEQHFILLGFGAVAQCLLPLLIQNNIRPHQIKIIEPKSYQHKIKNLMEQGLSYFNEGLNQENFEQILSQHAQPEDIIIDLSVDVDTIEIVNWCASHRVLYINTAIDDWKTEFKFPDIYDFEKDTLNYAHHLIAPLMAKYKQKKCPTIILEHGANPGLVSHLVKKALIDMTEYLIDKNQFTESGKDYLKDKNFQHLAKELGVKVIHISEKDTQISRFAKQPNEFLNTWSIDGLFWESIAPAEVGWGTHEKIIPFEGELNRIGNQRAVVLKKCGKNVWVKSWVPDENILGMVIKHGETLTIHEHLSIKDALGNYIYSPTVHYAYSPTTHTILSLHELEERSLQLQSNIRVMNDEITSGQDKLGVLLMGNPHTSWWTGSLLDIKTSRNIVSNQSATTLQVAGSVISAIIWMLKNPDKGIMYPDELPFEPILKGAERYWGGYHSLQTDFKPSRMKVHPFCVNDHDNAWQFIHFLAKT